MAPRGGYLRVAGDDAALEDEDWREGEGSPARLGCLERLRRSALKMVVVGTSLLIATCGALLLVGASRVNGSFRATATARMEAAIALSLVSGALMVATSAAATRAMVCSSEAALIVTSFIVLPSCVVHLATGLVLVAQADVLEREANRAAHAEGPATTRAASDALNVARANSPRIGGVLIVVALLLDVPRRRCVKALRAASLKGPHIKRRRERGAPRAPPPNAQASDRSQQAVADRVLGPRLMHLHSPRAGGPPAHTTDDDLEAKAGLISL